jgi:hypothetical protein
LRDRANVDRVPADEVGVAYPNAALSAARLLVTTRETDEFYRRAQGVPPFDAAWDITLTADGDQTTLVIEVKRMPLDKIAFFGAGWHGRTRPSLSGLVGQHQLSQPTESVETGTARNRGTMIREE